MSESSFSLGDIAHIIECLRDDKFGCAWDREQNVADILPHLLEEVYEVIDAIQRNNSDDIVDELGDLLFQILFFCHLYQEEKRFYFSDVLNAIGQKLIRRHPHVFPSGSIDSFGLGKNQTLEDARNIW